MCGPEQESSGTLLTRIQCQAIQFSVHLNFIPFILPSLNLLTICFLAISSKNDSKAIHRILWTWRRDRHWTYIAAYVEHTVECTLDVHWSVHGTLHCTVYSGHTLEYIALHTGVHRTVYWTYGGLYTRRAHMCPRCAQLCIWPEYHSPNVSSYAPDIFQLWCRYISDCPDVFQLCSSYVPLCTWTVQMCTGVFAGLYTGLYTRMHNVHWLYTVLYTDCIQYTLDVHGLYTMYTGCTLLDMGLYTMYR